MKLLVFVIAVFAVVAADVSHLAGNEGYNYPHAVEEHHHHEEVPIAIQESTQYLPPADEGLAPAPIVEEIAAIESQAEPANDYLPPQEQIIEEVVPQTIEEVEPAHEFADDGYRYRTVKRYRYRYKY